MISETHQVRIQLVEQEDGLRPDRRHETRLKRYGAISFNRDGTLDLRFGCVVDLCCSGVGLLVAVNDCPQVGDQLWLRIADLPPQNSLSDMSSFTACGHVLRCDGFSDLLRRIAVQFSAMVDFRLAVTTGLARPAVKTPENSYARTRLG